MKPHEKLMRVMQQHNREQMKIAQRRLKELAAIDTGHITVKARGRITKKLDFFTAYKMRHSAKVTKALEVLLTAYADDRQGQALMKRFCMDLIGLDVDQLRHHDWSTPRA
jgi:hypothetical protein